MTPEIALDVAREALILSMLISLPLLGVGLIIGVLISIVQAVTQVQEMTLTFVPKILAMVIAAAFMMPYILDEMMSFTIKMLSPMPVP